MSNPVPDREPAEPSIPTYPPDLFAGTAQDYDRYRLPYPQVLIDDLRKRAEVTGEGRLLDLACGPGRVTFPLAPFFQEVWAVDLKPEMVAFGRRKAEADGVTNIRWMTGRAEDVAAPAGAFELITIGEAVHRLDQVRVANLAAGPGRQGGGL